MEEKKANIEEKEATMGEKTVTIDGVVYVPEGVGGYSNTDHVCVIADRGWIFEGYRREDGTLGEAHVVRKWSNGLGIGGLADPAHKDDYTLDYIGDIAIAERAEIATIPLRW